MFCGFAKYGFAFGRLAFGRCLAGIAFFFRPIEKKVLQFRKMCLYYMCPNGTSRLGQTQTKRLHIMFKENAFLLHPWSDGKTFTVEVKYNWMQAKATNTTVSELVEKSLELFPQLETFISATYIDQTTHLIVFEGK